MGVESPNFEHHRVGARTPEDHLEPAALTKGQELEDVEGRIEQLRAKVDGIDQEIVDRLNERARIVLEIRNLKKEGKLPLYDPSREEDIFERVTQANDGPLYDDSLREIYERILQCMKSFD